MAKFIFENDSNDEKEIEIIKCPNPKDCNNEMGDGRYDLLHIPADKSETVETDCDEICWRYNGGQYTRTSDRVISV